MAKVHPELYFNIEESVTCLAFSKEAQKILVGTVSGQIQIWSLKSQMMDKKVAVFCEKEPLLWIGQLSDSTFVAQARFSNNLKLIGISSACIICQKESSKILIMIQN